MQRIALVLIAMCLALVATFWLKPTVQAAPPAELASDIRTGYEGTIVVSSKVEAAWSEWNGRAALYAHRNVVLHDEAGLARLHLLYPAFTYGPFDDKAAAEFRHQVDRWAADAHLRLDEEPRLALFRARFLSDPKAVALVPSSLTAALGLDSAAAIQRLALVRAEGAP